MGAHVQPVEIQEPYDLSESFDISRAISHGMDALKAQPIGMLVGGLLLTFTQGGTGGGGGGGDFGQGGGFSEAQIAAFGVLIGLGLCCGVLFLLVRCWFEPGWYRFHRELARDGDAQLGVMFTGSDAFVSMLLWKLLKGLISFGSLTVAMLPGAVVAGFGYLQDQNAAIMIAGGALAMVVGIPAMIYVSLGLLFGERAVALDGYKPVDALDLSWNMARGNRFHMLIFSIATGLFTLLGLLLCCIGVIATRAVTDFGFTEGYLLATRSEARDYKLTGRA